jgi:hypothetical protein
VSGGGYGVKWPLTDISRDMLDLCVRLSVRFSTICDEIVVGRSWEMAAIMWLLGRAGVYTGTVDKVSYSKDVATVWFGPVNGVGHKKLMAPSLVTCVELPSVQIRLCPSHIKDD